MFFGRKTDKKQEQIAFYWMSEDFISYDWPRHISDYPYTLSIFEAEESCYNSDVMNTFVEIIDRLTMGHIVLHLAKNQGINFICTGINKDVFRKQVDSFIGWDETEVFCYYKKNNQTIDHTMRCDLYFIVDVFHANLTIKCFDKNTYEIIKEVLICVLNELNFKLMKWTSEK